MVRLPKNVNPLYYDLVIEPDLSNLVYTARLNMGISINESDFNREVFIHMKEIEVKNLFISDIKDTQTIFNGYTEFDSRYREDTY